MKRDWESKSIPKSVRRLAEQQRRLEDLGGGAFRRVFKDLQDRASIIDRLRPQMRALELSDLASHSMYSLLESPALLSLSADIARANEFWSSLSRERARLDKVAESLSTVMSRELVRAAELSIAAETLLSRVDWNGLSRMLADVADLQTGIEKSFVAMSESYSDLLESMDGRVETLVALPPTVTRFPPVEYHNSTHLLHEVSGEDAESSPETARISNEIAEENESTLFGLLADLDLGFPTMLNGARDALNSDNPDRARHVSASLRELLDHVLRKLAPDSAVMKEEHLASTFDKKRPTRRTRLLYLVRDINNPPFGTFVEKDVAAALEFLNLFQRGTHKVSHAFTEPQLRALLVRSESLLRFLLERAKEIQ